MPKCDQCSAVRINGVFCHERGCPNTSATWDTEREQWIRYKPCWYCGDDIEFGTECDCLETESPDDEPEDYVAPYRSI